VNQVLETHAAGEEVLTREAQQSLDAVADRQYRQPGGKLQPEGGFKRGRFHFLTVDLTLLA
jgi:hypothetical protein